MQLLSDSRDTPVSQVVRSGLWWTTSFKNVHSPPVPFGGGGVSPLAEIVEKWRESKGCTITYNSI